ncbi:MAG: response regulator transcription factor [Eudoraea sp.]|nr:response regulator transcription factor [Muriicola sp.]NNE01539.1 response regulator transcription factor [Eudoraea sp.]
MKHSKIRVVLVDDELRALNRMKLLLGNFPEIEISGQFHEPQESIDFILRDEPDIVFLDIEMAGKTGLDIAIEIQRNNLETRTIYCTAHEHYAIKAIKTNAFDYLLKPIGIDDLKATINRFKAQSHSGLSKRELEIIRLLAEGKNSKAIGEQLFISRHTVDTYRRKILQKTNCKNSAELITFASKNNIV